MNSDQQQKAIDRLRARIRAFVLQCVDERSHGLATYVSASIGAPQGNVYKEVQVMVREGLLCAEGHGAQRRYWISEKGKIERSRLKRHTYAHKGKDDFPESDADLLQRKPRTMQEAERRAWLLRKLGRKAGK